MKNRMKLVWRISVIFSLFLVGGVLAQEFSADVIHITKEGTSRGKVFTVKDKSRMEFPDSIAITRMDKNVVWMLMPAEKMYMEQPFDPSAMAAARDKVPGEIERTLVGQELVDGRMASKYRIVYEVQGIRATIFQWIAGDLNIPVKTAAEDGSWSMEYKNIKTGSQPDFLFEVPADYKKLSTEMPWTEYSE